MMERYCQLGTSQATSAVEHIPKVHEMKESMTARARRSGGISSMSVDKQYFVWPEAQRRPNNQYDIDVIILYIKRSEGKFMFIHSLFLEEVTSYVSGILANIQGPYKNMKVLVSNLALKRELCTCVRLSSNCWDKIMSTCEL